MKSVLLFITSLIAGLSVAHAAPKAEDDFLKLFSSSKPLIAAVMVNAEDQAVRSNRLSLLKEVDD
ncbi:MAG: hypothetical protein K2P92_08285, partial [Bdellovibrionaceae bacterium]|nr:hypothetical protein [Pseudobdellovibrionaceae bacterium]